MAELNRINSFKSFTEVKAQNAALKLREENQLKRQELASNFAAILDEMGLTSLQELDEETQRTFISKVLGRDISEEAPETTSDVEEVTEGLHPKLKKAQKAIEKGETVYGENVRFPGRFKIVELGNMFATVDYEDGTEPMEMASMNIRIDSLQFESVETEEVTESLNEGIIVTGKRDAKKVLTQYNKFFEKYPALGRNAMGVPQDHHIGALKLLYAGAMHDANFHREADSTTNVMKGRLFAVEVKVSELNNAIVKVSAGKLQNMIEDHVSAIAGAAGWSGLAIVEGTALYLDSIKKTQEAENLMAKFNQAFNEGEEIRVDVDSKLNESEETVSEGAVKAFDMDVEYMIKDIKRGYGWIDPAYVQDTWENTSDTIDFEIVQAELLKRLIDAGLLAFPHPDNEEVSGKQVRSLREIGIKESVVNEAKFKKGQYIKAKSSSDKFTGDIYDRTNEVDGSEIEKGEEFEIYEIGKDEVILWSDEYQVEYSIDPEDLKYFIKESVVNEAEVTSDEEFKEYAFSVLQKAFGDDFDEAKAQEVVDGILDKCGDDYGACVGTLTSSLG